jgi:hypothetical protein
VGSFTIGNPQLVGSFEPTFELAPIVVDEVVRYLRLRVMPGTSISSAVFVTAGGGANCTCDTSGGGPDPYNLDPELVDNTQIGPGISADYARGDHVHGLAYSDDTLPEDVLPPGGTASAGLSVWPARRDHVHVLADLLPFDFTGTYFTFDIAVDGSERIDQIATDAPVTAELHWARRVTRKVSSPWPLQTDEFIAELPTSNREVGLFQNFWAKRTDTLELRHFMRTRESVYSNADTGQWLDPAIFFGGLLSTWELGLAGGDDETFRDNTHVFNSDGNLTSRPLLPAGGPYFLASHVIDGYQFQTPADGTIYGYWVKNLGRFGYTQDAHSGSGGNTLTDSSAFWQLTRIVDSGFTAAFSNALELYPGELRIVNFHADELARLVLEDGENSPVSGSNEAAFRYRGTTDKAELSVNAGAYEAILTSPSAAVGAVVDVPSASTDFKTATTFTIVPTAGRRFLPIAAYVEFTTITALATGPTIKLGNNVAHDNVAPDLVVANTAVTDNALPFVMATIPQVIDLTATGIIGEMTVNAAGTTCTGRVHVLGVYIT